MKGIVFGAIGLLIAGQVEAVRLRWDAPAIGEPTGYTMYRGIMVGQRCSDTAQPVMELYGVTPVEVQPEFVDNSPVVGANYYEVTAYNSEGESLPSNRVCFQRQGEKTGPPLNLRVE